VLIQPPSDTGCHARVINLEPSSQANWKTMPEKVPRLPIYQEDQEFWSPMACEWSMNLGTRDSWCIGLHGHRGLMDALESWHLVYLKPTKQGIKEPRNQQSRRARSLVKHEGYFPWLHQRLGKWGSGNLITLVAWQLEIHEPMTQGTMRPGSPGNQVSRHVGGNETCDLGIKAT
jgi:hypothetical protein